VAEETADSEQSRQVRLEPEHPDTGTKAARMVIAVLVNSKFYKYSVVELMKQVPLHALMI
jgi:hypothetical protein